MSFGLSEREAEEMNAEYLEKQEADAPPYRLRLCERQKRIWRIFGSSSAALAAARL